MGLLDKVREEREEIRRDIQLKVEEIFFKGQIRIALNQLIINGSNKESLKQFCQEVIGD